eukprot:6900237-Pyramimonas_sp.AAC.1
MGYGKRARTNGATASDEVSEFAHPPISPRKTRSRSCGRKRCLATKFRTNGCPWLRPVGFATMRSGEEMLMQFTMMEMATMTMATARRMRGAERSFTARG